MRNSRRMISVLDILTFEDFAEKFGLTDIELLQLGEKIPKQTMSQFLDTYNNILRKPYHQFFKSEREQKKLVELEKCLEIFQLMRDYPIESH